jgi:hypothetical protein
LLKVFAGFPGGRTLSITTVPAWGLAKLALERAIERRFRFVSNVGGDFRYAS